MSFGKAQSKREPDQNIPEFYRNVSKETGCPAADFFGRTGRT